MKQSEQISPVHLTGKYAKDTLTTLENLPLDIDPLLWRVIRKIILDKYADFRRELETMTSATQDSHVR